MSYRVSFDETYAEGQTYTGPCEHFTCEIQATPGLRGIIKAAVKGWFYAQGYTLLRFRLMQDTTPTFDKYKIDVWGHGSVIAWALLIGVITALAGVALLWWGVVNEDWNPTSWLKYGAIIAVAGVAVLVMTRRK